MYAKETLNMLYPNLHKLHALKNTWLDINE